MVLVRRDDHGDVIIIQRECADQRMNSARRAVARKYHRIRLGRVDSISEDKIVGSATLISKHLLHELFSITITHLTISLASCLKRVV